MRLLVTLLIISFFNPLRAGASISFWTTCGVLMLTPKENAEKILKLISPTEMQEFVEKFGREIASKIGVGVDSSEFLIASKIAFIKVLQEEFKLFPNKFSETLDQMMLTAKDPIDRIVALKMKTDSITSSKSSHFRIAPDEAIELFWKDFENGTTEVQQNILLTMLPAILSEASSAPAMMKFYQTYATESGMLRILSALNIVIREKPERVPPEIVQALFPNDAHNYVDMRKLAPSSFFMMALIRAYGALANKEVIVLRNVDLRDKIKKLFLDATEKGDPYIKSVINNLINNVANGI